MTTRRGKLLLAGLAMVCASAIPVTAWGYHCDSYFSTDIGPLMLQSEGETRELSNACPTGTYGCNDYFDITLQAGDTFSIGAQSYSSTPYFSVWSGAPFSFDNQACSSYSLTFVAPTSGTYRVRVGILGYDGSYTMAYSAPVGSTIVGGIPVCYAVDARDDRYDVINDGSNAEFDVLGNDACKGDDPISVSPQPGDLLPDRGGVATTDGDTILYTPAPGFAGFEEFDYTAEDAGLDGGDDPPSLDRDRARVVVTVLEDLQPVAEDDVLSVDQGQTVYIDVLANDFPGNEPITAVEVVTPPENGSATVQTDQTIRYRSDYYFFGEDGFEYRLVDANGDADVARVDIGVHFVQGAVPIDVIPNDAGNNLNLNGGPGSGFHVAILSAGEFFDAPGQIDPLSLKLGPRGANIFGNPTVRDIDRDGDDDLLVKFLTDQTGIACGDTHVNLTGRTYGSRSISGQDVINTFACPRVRKRY